MTRDPSDGSVRELTPEIDVLLIEEVHHVGRNLMGKPQTMEVLRPSTSGLPITKAKADYLERLEESRKWLKSYVRPTING